MTEVDVNSDWNPQPQANGHAQRRRDVSLDVPQVLLIEEDATQRRALAWLAEATGARVTALSGLRDLPGSLAADEPGCLVVSVAFPRREGPDVLEALHAAGIGLPVIFLCGQLDVNTAVGLFRGGAFDVFEKPLDGNVLQRRIAAAIELDQRRCRRDMHRRQYRERLSRLTPRELEVLDLLVAGMSIKQIASYFNVTVQTAAKHRSRLLAKMGVDNDVGLVNLAHAAGRVDRTH